MTESYLNYYPGTCLKSVRLSKSLKNSDLSEGLISTSYYSKVEANQSVPSLSVFLALIYRLNVSSAEFFYISRDYHLSPKEDFCNFLATIEYRSDADIENFLLDTKRQFKYTNDQIFQIYYEVALYFQDKSNKPLRTIEYLSIVESWYIQDIILFSLISNEYTNEYIDIQAETLYRKLSKYINYPTANSILPMILYRISIRMAKMDLDIFEYHALKAIEILNEINLLDSKTISLFLTDLLAYFKNNEANSNKLTIYLDFWDLMGMAELKKNIENDLNSLGIISQ